MSGLARSHSSLDTVHDLTALMTSVYHGRIFYRKILFTDKH
jgi:hypothetical protein